MSSKDITTIREIDIDLEAIDCIRCFPYKPYYYMAPTLSKTEIDNNFFHELTRLKKESDHHFFIARKGNTIKGMAVLRELGFDSRLFGFNCAKLLYLIADNETPFAFDIKSQLLEVTLDWAKKENIKFLHTRVDVTDLPSIHSLEKNQFHFMSSVGRYTFLANKARLILPHSRPVRSYKNEDLEKLKTMSFNIFPDNRFSLDKRFKKDKINAMYSAWIENACLGHLQDEVFVYPYKDDIVGFCTCGIKKDDGTFTKRIGAIDLLGITRSFQGHGAGVKVLQNAIAWLKKYSDITEAVMAAQNIEMILIACRFGYEPKTVQQDYHYWAEG